MLDLLFHLGLLVLDGGGKRGAVRLQVGNRTLQIAYRLRILGQGRRLLRCLLLRLGGRRLGCRRCLLGLLQLLVAIAQLLLQLLNLRIHVLPQRFNLALHRRLFGYWRLLGGAFMGRSRYSSYRTLLSVPARQTMPRQAPASPASSVGSSFGLSLLLNRSATTMQEKSGTSARA